jgi:hypothetical protein
MPRICQIVDGELPNDMKLAKQYITVMEVGGAYANIFYPLLDFLELKTLVITDLDAVHQNGNGSWVKCRYSLGKRTSNNAIKKWFEVKEGEQISLMELAEKKAQDKIAGYRRLAYQIPEPTSDYCARSYEDALILANPDEFGLVRGEDWEDLSWTQAQDMPKTETALRFAIEVPVWNVPHYIKEGLFWLSEPPALNEKSGIANV